MQACLSRKLDWSSFGESYHVVPSPILQKECPVESSKSTVPKKEISMQGDGEW